ncbi:hypothetical protein, partial [Salmonella enterica]|uniref:hypothetical protein n=1 Tax=Salmonella enterica TaxID=28901 RepID=UPI001A7F0B96
MHKNGGAHHGNKKINHNDIAAIMELMTHLVNAPLEPEKTAAALPHAHQAVLPMLKPFTPPLRYPRCQRLGCAPQTQHSPVPRAK